MLAHINNYGVTYTFINQDIYICIKHHLYHMF